MCVNQLKNRVKYLYKYGKENLIEQIMKTDNWNNIIYRQKYLEILNQHEEQIKGRIQDNIKSLKSEKSTLQKEKEKKETLINSKNREFKNLENDKRLKQIYLEKIQNQMEFALCHHLHFHVNMINKKIKKG